MKTTPAALLRRKRARPRREARERVERARMWVTGIEDAFLIAERRGDREEGRRLAAVLSEALAELGAARERWDRMLQGDTTEKEARDA